MTWLQQNIYNTYLRISRSIKGKPYRSRIDFEGFEEDKNYVFVVKLANFFQAHESVNIELFFRAPYEIYGKNEDFYLDFYLTAKAHKAYSLYVKQIKDAEPDSSEQLNFIVESARFVSQFCHDNNLPVDRYLDYTPAATPAFIQHLLGCKVSIYFLLGFPAFETRLRAFDWELTKFMLGEDFFDKLENSRVKYLTSEKAKLLTLKAIEKIKK
jgi:hypothetical protein